MPHLKATADELDLEEKRAWVHEVEANDYFFWHRFFERLDRSGTEFPQPEHWYRPAEIVEGGEGTARPRATEAERTISPDAWDEARAYAFDRKSGVLLVARHGRIEYEAYAQGYHSGSLLPVRSITKSIVAVLFGVAIERGYIASLDDPVELFLVEWRGEQRGQITIRQLLTFSSGLEAVSMGEFEADSKAVRLAEGGRVNETALSYQLQYEPDAQLVVNNADTQLAGLILERATQRRFAELVGDWLWRPLGAGAATLNLDALNGDARTFCCMRGRAIDWISLGQLFLDDGAYNGSQVVPKAFMEAMREPSIVHPRVGLSIMLGWDESHAAAGNSSTPRLIFPQQQPFESPGVVHLTGGRSISLWIAPHHEMIVFRWGEDVADWDNAVIVNTLVRGISDDHDRQ